MSDILQNTLLDNNNLKKILQCTYFALNPLNPKICENYYQEVFRENLKMNTGLRVDSEITNQRDTHNMYGDLIRLKNKTERYDLICEDLETLFELKHSSGISDEYRNQMFNYLDKSKYKYGIVVNFMKFNNNKLCAQYEVYEKSHIKEIKDMFGDYYAIYKYKMIDSFCTEDYLKLMGGYIHVPDENNEKDVKNESIEDNESIDDNESIESNEGNEDNIVIKNNIIEIS